MAPNPGRQVSAMTGFSYFARFQGDSFLDMVSSLMNLREVVIFTYSAFSCNSRIDSFYRLKLKLESYKSILN